MLGGWNKDMKGLPNSEAGDPRLDIVTTSSNLKQWGEGCQRQAKGRNLQYGWSGTRALADALVLDTRRNE